jgi:hypothetical protein
MRLSAGVSLALSELCQDCRYGGGRIPLSAILDLSTCQNFTTICVHVRAQQLPSETAPKRVRSAGTPCGKRRSQAAHSARSYLVLL